MLQDCDTAIQWVSDNIHRYGGDPDNVYIVGQSAGAHISSLCLFAQVNQQTAYGIARIVAIAGTQVCPASSHSMGSSELDVICND